MSVLLGFTSFAIKPYKAVSADRFSSSRHRAAAAKAIENQLEPKRKT